MKYSPVLAGLGASSPDKRVKTTSLMDEHLPPSTQLSVLDQSQPIELFIVSNESGNEAKLAELEQQVASAVVPEKKATTLGCKDEATDAACSQLVTLKSDVLLLTRKALVAAQDSRQVTAPAPILDAVFLPLLRALGAVAEDGRTATETVALTSSLDQALAYLGEAREARAAAFNAELRDDLKAQGLPELTQSLLSISAAGREDDDKCVFLSASQLLRTGNGKQVKRGRASA